MLIIIQIRIVVFALLVLLCYFVICILRNFNPVVFGPSINPLAAAAIFASSSNCFPAQVRMRTCVFISIIAFNFVIPAFNYDWSLVLMNLLQFRSLNLGYLRDLLRGVYHSNRWTWTSPSWRRRLFIWPGWINSSTTFLHFSHFSHFSRCCSFSSQTVFHFSCLYKLKINLFVISWYYIFHLPI